MRICGTLSLRNQTRLKQEHDDAVRRRRTAAKKAAATKAKMARAAAREAARSARLAITPEQRRARWAAERRARRARARMQHPLPPYGCQPQRICYVLIHPEGEAAREAAELKARQEFLACRTAMPEAYVPQHLVYASILPEFAGKVFTIDGKMKSHGNETILGHVGSPPHGFYDSFAIIVDGKWKRCGSTTEKRHALNAEYLRLEKEKLL